MSGNVILPWNERRIVRKRLDDVEAEALVGKAPVGADVGYAVDDFILGLSAGWGGESVVARPGEAGHPGIVRVAGSEEDDGSLFASGVYSTDVALFRAVVRPLAGCDELAFKVGLVDDPADPVEGVYFVVSIAESDYWCSVTRDAGDDVLEESAVECEVGEWYLLEIEKVGNAYNFSIDGELVATHAAHIPRGVHYPGFVAKVSGQVASGMDIDFFSLQTVETGR